VAVAFSAPKVSAAALLAASLAVPADQEPTAPPLPEGNAYVRSLIGPSGPGPQDEAINDYAYEFEEIREELNGKGQVTSRRSRRSQVYFVKGRPVRRLVSQDGVPLSAKKQAQEDRRAIEKSTAIREGRTIQERPGIRLSILFDRFDFKTLRRETRAGRETLVLAFSPRSGTDRKTEKRPADALARVLEGTVWIDETARRVVRIEAKNQSGASAGVATGVRVGELVLVAEFQRLEGSVSSGGETDGVWLPTRTETVASGRAFLFRKFHVRQTTIYSNYRRFSVATEERPVSGRGDPAAGGPHLGLGHLRGAHEPSPARGPFTFLNR
jgi:hypothetical protein